MQANDILRQEELRVERRFESFGSEVQQAISRVFMRFGHFRPLLAHLQLDSSGDVESQQQTLLRCLYDCGTERFMKGINQGKNPAEIDVPNEIALDHMESTRKIAAALQRIDAEAAAAKSGESPAATPRSTYGPGSPGFVERRKSTTGRRKKVILDFPDDRRKNPNRRSTD